MSVVHKNRRRLPAVAGVLAMLGAGVVFFGSSARAQVSGDYDLGAVASMLDIHIADASLPVTQTVDASPYGASISMSSTGVVKADAGAPYAPFGYSLPSTITGLGSGNLPSIPPFPGYVAASYPAAASNEQKTGGYELVATTAEHSALGQVKLGNQQVGSSDSTGYAVAQSLAKDDGTVTVSGAAGAAPLSFGGVFDLGRVASVLTMTKSQTGKPTVSGTTDLGTVTLASTFTSGVRGNGTLLAGRPVAVTPSSIETLNSALAPYGMKLSYLPRTYGYADGTTSTGAEPIQSKTVRTINSGALQVTVRQKVPTQGIVDVVYTLGRVTLSAHNNPSDSPATGADVIGGALGPVLPGTANGIAGAGATVDAPTGALPGTGTTQPVGLGPAAPGAGPKPATVALTPAGTERISLAGRATTDGSSSYLLVVLAAIGTAGAVQLVRFLAIK